MAAGISNASITAPLFSLKDKTIIWATQNAVHGSTNMYGIGAGKTFYLVGAGLAYRSVAATGEVKLRTDVTMDNILFMNSTTAAVESGHLFLSLAIPLPIYGVQNIEVSSDADNVLATGWIMGWEE